MIRWWDGSQWLWAEPADPTRIILRWPSGNVVGEFAVESVEEFKQHCDEGLYGEYGVTRAYWDPEEADPDEERNYVIGYYTLLYGTIELACGKQFSEYGMPDGAEVTLMLRQPPYPNL